jgi:hypothetical protein
VHNGVVLFDMHGTVSTLVPFGEGFAAQSLDPRQTFSGGGSNKICVMKLQQIGVGNAGVAYQVTDADCQDCNDLECGSGCPETVGWVFVMPGGMETITGG